MGKHNWKKWNDFRFNTINEDSEVHELNWLTDAIVRYLIGNPVSAAKDLKKYRKVITQLVNSKNFNNSYNILYKEINEALKRTIEHI